MTELSNGTEIGSDFVGYRIEALVGLGGMGVVYRAYDLRLKRTVALKLITPELALDERFRTRFDRETELAMALEHPNVVPIHDAGDVDGRLYLAMRFVEGDLRTLLRKENLLEAGRALAICRQVANALDAAHAKGLIHRDVKPSNVLLDQGEHVYLGDFGLTRRLEEQGAQPEDGRSIGTPAYLAPEQIEGGAVDGRADVYALGCMLFECLTGKPPFGGASRLETAWAHLEEPPPRASSLRELPDAVDRVFATALAKDPADRYPTCSALVSAAEEALGLRRSRPLRRRGVLLAATAAVIAVLAAAIAAALLATGGHAKAAAKPLFAGPNTVARIDPTTNKVSAVVKVGAHPVVVAAAGHRVWVYNQGDLTISDVDAGTDHVLRTTPTSGYIPAECCSLFAGPVLAANVSGAWFVNGGDAGKARLTHIVADDGRKREYPLDLTPTGVATGAGSVWIVGHRGGDYRLLRIDPATGRVTATTRFPSRSRVDSIAFGYGRVWIMSSSTATLYRVAPRSARRTGSVAVASSRATRPEIVPYAHWITVRTLGGQGGGTEYEVDPFSLAPSFGGNYGPPDWEEYNGALGALWWYDWPSGTVNRQESENGHVTTIQVTRLYSGHPCLTSMTAGSGSLWVTAAPGNPPNGGPCIR
ncbi:MAG TPA: serine/threonine-protein kinase [Gaiellaceae bacterium]|nr:serine/threonine-protein kinase [Gaiellaceae bacterium]